MPTVIWRLAFSTAAAVAVSGCAIFQNVADIAAGRALAPASAQGSGEPQPASGSGQPAAAPATAAAISPWASPQVAPAMLMIAFHPMGLPVGGTDLKPGEFVRWSLGDGTDREMPAFIERARLPDDAGNQAWRVKWGAGTGEAVTIEGVISSDGQIVRLREKYSGDGIVRDLPVQTAQGAVAAGMQKIAPEQIGATNAGVEPVTVPAGTFSASHYVIQRNGGTAEWWFSESVPGGIVKFSGHSENRHKDNVALIQVLAFGNNAVSEL